MYLSVALPAGRAGPLRYTELLFDTPMQQAAY